MRSRGTDHVPDEAELERIRTAGLALHRGGQIHEPPMEHWVAAYNWIVRQELAETLLEAVRGGEASLRVIDGRLTWIGPRDTQIDVGAVAELQGGGG